VEGQVEVVWVVVVWVVRKGMEEGVEEVEE
jgi:SNF family Na+-dependent transporter